MATQRMTELFDFESLAQKVLHCEQRTGLCRSVETPAGAAANDLHRLYGAQELSDRRWCPFALTTGRNVVSWIGRHSQHEDRHHAQLRTIHRQRLASGTSSAC